MKAGPQGPCLDHCGESHTRVPHGIRSGVKVENRARVYLSGELEVSTVARDGASRPPGRRFGPRLTRGVSSRSGRRMRRAVIARHRQGGCQWVLLTFTSRDLRSDEEMRRKFDRLLMWGRKYLPGHFDFYVWVAELQARGVLHFHLLIPKRVPDGLFRRLRRLWAEVYGMGGGSVDIEKLRSGKGAASYMAKMVRYLRKKPAAYRLGLDAEGCLSWEPWRVGRNGSVYERMLFRGRASDMSRLARNLSGVVIELAAPWGDFAGLTLRGRSWYFESPQEAEAFLTALLSSSDTG